MLKKPPLVNWSFATTSEVAQAVGQLDELSGRDFSPERLRAILEDSDQVFVGYADRDLCMLGGLKFGTLAGRTFLWSVQTLAATRHPAAVIRGTRRFIDKLNQIVYCYSKYDDRWLRLIGFEPVGQSGEFTEYERKV